ncbi:MAG TPA: ABC transporter substrate-binding protein [Candidatus Paceibacterota bacterium]
MKPNSKIASFFNAIFVNFRHVGVVLKIEKVVKKMAPAEKILFSVCAATFAVSALVLLFRVHSSFLVEIPSFGGSFTEGSVGSPRFINPVLAISDTDKDLASLVYAGLIKMDDSGAFVPDLAESYEVLEGGTVYYATLKEDAYFHDGEKVTTDDIIFTLNKITDPTVKSPRAVSWSGVSVEKISDREIRFTLSKSYAPFLEAMTVGILPKHIWEKASSEEFPFSEFNINPVGSGPYKIKKVVRNGGGIPTSITLSAFQNYALGSPKIKTINLKFFQNENELYRAYKDREIDSMVGLSPVTAKKLEQENTLSEESSLPRVFGLFFNQNTATVLLNREVREALDVSAPKQQIVDEVLFGFGKPLNGPTPDNVENNPEMAVGNMEKAKEILSQSGWSPNEEGVLTKKTKSGTEILKFAITTSDSPELKSAASILKETWKNLGAEIDIKVFEAGDLSQNIIKGRKYDALLFGEVVSNKSDLYPFWHSSERNDPGLNIALYANITADKLLEEMREDLNVENEREKREALVAEIKSDLPAVFLFSPDLLYVRPEKVKNLSLKNISSPSERFTSIQKWFIETDKVWEIFADRST